VPKKAAGSKRAPRRVSTQKSPRVVKTVAVAIRDGRQSAEKVFAGRATKQTKRRSAVRQHALAARRKGGAEAALAETFLARNSTGTLVAEGDSWFDYPFYDVLKLLDDDYGYEIYSVAHKGDAVEIMAYDGGQLDEFARCLEQVLRSGTVPKAVLLSGGGNDVAGDAFAMLINHKRSPVPGLGLVSGVHWSADRVPRAP